jgi:8-oxo-dGTP diphosphatase
LNDNQVLLVRTNGSQWSLPGGTIRRNESPDDAVRRELLEETGLVAKEVNYLFVFGGLNKRHHVYWVNVGLDARPVPRNEIAQCRWFDTPLDMAIAVKVPAREIVGLLDGARLSARDEDRGA